MASELDADGLRPSISDTEKVPFLEDGRQDLIPATTTRLGACPRYLWVWVAHGVFFLLYTILFLTTFVIKTHHPPSGDPLLWSPAQDVVEWETRIIDAIPGSTPYTGYPNPESDAAWASLLEGISLKILPDEMERLGYTSLALKDGSGYVGSLGVYHELHCIKRVRKMVYRDYYYPNMTTDEWHHRMGHIEHCLEQIRQSAICHGDINVIPFSWIQDEEHQTASPTMQFGSLHQCVKWDNLDGWAKSRRLDLFDEDLLVPAELDR